MPPWSPFRFFGSSRRSKRPPPAPRRRRRRRLRRRTCRHLETNRRRSSVKQTESSLLTLGGVVRFVLLEAVVFEDWSVLLGAVVSEDGRRCAKGRGCETESARHGRSSKVKLCKNRFRNKCLALAKLQSLARDAEEGPTEKKNQCPAFRNRSNEFHAKVKQVKRRLFFILIRYIFMHL